ncbi:MAG: exodeoxyribonuclease VII small subunit [Bacteroidia bacterium]|nr:exodeoxyribonuclease VII small subunit [Bacteroidia bacterium]
MAKQELTYNKAFAELEKIVACIENEEIEIDNLAKQVKRAAELLAFCKEKLHSSEAEISKIMKEMGDAN